MSTPAATQHLPSVPEIVRIVLTQAARFRAIGAIPRKTFEAQIARLSAEELAPRGWSLGVRELTGGKTRFIIRSSAGIIDIVECQPRRAAGLAR